MERAVASLVPSFKNVTLTQSTFLVDLLLVLLLLLSKIYIIYMYIPFFGMFLCFPPLYCIIFGAADTYLPHRDQLSLILSLQVLLNSSSCFTKVFQKTGGQRLPRLRKRSRFQFHQIELMDRSVVWQYIVSLTLHNKYFHNVMHLTILCALQIRSHSTFQQINSTQ